MLNYLLVVRNLTKSAQIPPNSRWINHQKLLRRLDELGKLIELTAFTLTLDVTDLSSASIRSNEEANNCRLQV